MVDPSIERAVWYVALLIEAALLVRMHSWRVDLPWFRLYLAYDLIRWAALAMLNAVEPENVEAYRSIWQWTEPLSIGLLVCVGIEASVRLLSRKTRPELYWIACALFVVLDMPRDTADQFFVRSVVAASIIASLLLLMGGSRVESHAVMLSIFCTADLISFGALAIKAMGDQRPGMFLLIAQACCLAGWVFYAPSISKNRPSLNPLGAIR